jgi:hypothetical protein
LKRRLPRRRNGCQPLIPRCWKQKFAQCEGRQPWIALSFDLLPSHAKLPLCCARDARQKKGKTNMRRRDFLASTAAIAASPAAPARSPNSWPRGHGAQPTEATKRTRCLTPCPRFGPLCACMFNPMVKPNEDKANGGFREWAEELVGGSRRWRDCMPGPRGLGCNHRDVAPTGRRGDAGTGRPISAPRLDLRTEPWAPVPDLVKLEPLNEP